MYQVAIFANSLDHRLEEQVNQFLAKLEEANVVEVKLSCSGDSENPNYTVLVMYKE
ncbi:sporulation protein Cse60 [Effusibacillus lacus]|uniref:Sporulation protein cse60 n=1 Tax=Effusibacillus lacus TaxID=1348429 RepID=A0A292YLI0_9BACL|nr:sporulation protein Cse60 [Effusibacillus lacus]TCS74205.1 uncharacterized protein DUF2758 [Effusibacillus lacus]GAX90798.1 hypothetical protein EFBL_2440 [Effusibacillus lacus]